MSEIAAHLQGSSPEEWKKDFDLSRKEAQKLFEKYRATQPDGLYQFSRSNLLKLRTSGYDFELDMLVKCKDTGRQIRAGRASCFVTRQQTGGGNIKLDKSLVGTAATEADKGIAAAPGVTEVSCVTGISTALVTVGRISEKSRTVVLT